MTPADRDSTGAGSPGAAARTAGVLLLAGLVFLVTRLSSVAMVAHPSNDPVLRLAWSARPERIEKCRQRTAEELAQLPQHMRQPLACEGASAEYRLQVRVAGELVADRVVHGGGLRRDRRLYVLQEIPIPPGAADISVRFDRIGDPPPDTGSGAVRPHPESVPPHMSFERRIDTSPRDVVLVTYSADDRQLIAVSAPSNSSR
jgi:hypothetical protein